MKRRSLLRGIIAAAAVIAFGQAAAAAHQAPRTAYASAPAATTVGGSGTAKTWQWVALPDSGGLQVHCTTAGTAAKVGVRWNVDSAGAVTVTANWPTPLTVTAPRTAGINATTSGAGYGLTVRRAP